MRVLVRARSLASSITVCRFEIAQRNCKPGAPYCTDTAIGIATACHWQRRGRLGAAERKGQGPELLSYYEWLLASLLALHASDSSVSACTLEVESA